MHTYSLKIRILSIMTLVAFLVAIEKMGTVPDPTSQHSLSGTVPIFSYIRAEAIGESADADGNGKPYEAIWQC